MVSLAGLHPDLIAKLNALMVLMDKAGAPMFVVQGLRTVEQQQALYAQGRTTKGPIVTNCDGVKVKSNHQAQADGFGHAADCAFKGAEPFSEHHPWATYGSAAKMLGLIWGGNFSTLVDRPHVELPHG
jgi:peptidoglycan L-alanyl-D-glutamate endopeptidase CwlK